MLTIITGGSGSGKSAYAEEYSVQHRKLHKPLYYIATMKYNPFDLECQAKILRHQNMRKKKGFQTIECEINLMALNLYDNSSVLLECMSNLVANQLFSNNKNLEINSSSEYQIVAFLLGGIQNLLSQQITMTIVTNEVFSDGIYYGKETTDYLRLLGTINQILFDIADVVIEIVYGIAIYQKGKR